MKIHPLHRVKTVHLFLKHNNIYNYTAQLSYGLMLAFLPMIMLFNWSLRFFYAGAGSAPEISEFIIRYFPPSLADLIVPSVTNVELDLSSGFHTLIGNIALLVFILYACTRLMRAIMVVSTKICRMREKRNFFLLWLLALRNLIIVVVFLALLIYIFLESRVIIVDHIRELPDTVFASALEWIWNRLIYLYMLVAVILMLNWIIAKAPAHPLKFRRALPGTFLTIIGWGLLITVFHYLYAYIGYEGLIQIVDSGITIVITIYLVSFILILGILLNDRIYLRNMSLRVQQFQKAPQIQQKF